VKKVLFYFAAFYIVSVVQANAVLVKLSPEQINSAREYGKQQKENIRQKLKKNYCAGECDLFGERVIIRTKYYKLALMSALRATYGKEFSKEQQSVITDDPALQLDVVVFGYKLDFAAKYTVTLLQDGKKIKPENIRAYHSQNPLHGERAWKGFPSFRATITCFFRYDHINPAGKAVLILNKDGKKKEFEIDLTQYK
jgi:hypothetical protein